jgi:hypothetical protein
MSPEVGSRLTTLVAPCRIELARSGCPILVPENGHTYADVIRWAQVALGLSAAEIQTGR